MGGGAQKYAADIVFLQVQGHTLVGSSPGAGPRELIDSIVHALFEAVNTGDTVTDLDNGAHIGISIALCICLAAAYNGADFFRSQNSGSVHPIVIFFA
jgi:hypothetical protein